MGVTDVPALNRNQANKIVQMSLPDRLATEGYPYASNAFFSGTAAAETIIGNLSLPGLTRAFWAEQAVIVANKNCIIRLNLSPNYYGGSVPLNYVDVIVAPGIPAVIPIRQFLRPGGFASPTGVITLGDARFKTILDADGTNAQARANLSGYWLTDDLNFGADKTLLHIGDSITAGGTGPTKKTNQYDWATLNYFKETRNVDIRMVNLSLSGSTSVDHERLRQYGHYDQPKVDFLTYSLGMNDAGNAVATATYKANVKAMIAHKQRRWPNATMLVYGSSPAENSTTETNAVAMRTAASEAVTEAADAKVKYVNLGAAFDRTVTSNYASTDTAGSRVHPSDAGHAAIWSVIKTFLDANPTVKP